MTVSTEHHSDVQGRYSKIATRGAMTRSALLDALEQELQATPWREITVIDIARSIGRSPAAFYCYFTDLNAAYTELTARRADAATPATRQMRLISALFEWKAEDELTPTVGSVSPSTPEALGAWLRALPFGTILSEPRGGAWQTGEGVESGAGPDRQFPALLSVASDVMEITETHPDLYALVFSAPFTVLALGRIDRGGNDAA